ncbi:MAG: TIGR03618 family F420-dependent PPOX class oxidoreductase [Candidatus Dormiibacterota bacterium]
MPAAPLPDPLQAFLRLPNPCVVATISPAGELHTAATWYEWRDDATLLLNMDQSRRRLAHLREDPRVALTVLDRESWYRHVSLIGRAREIRADPELQDIDRLSLHYTGRPYAARQQVRWSAIVDISRWHGWRDGKPVTEG